MDVVDQDALGRWDGLSSRDAGSRDSAMETIQQELMRIVEAIGRAPASQPRSPASPGPPCRVLNGILAHLLMLSKRCPFQDIRERCGWLLQTVQHVAGTGLDAWTLFMDNRPEPHHHFNMMCMYLPVCQLWHPLHS
ncbi:unnamed protein product [Arctogadus glacialis]